MQVPIPPPLPRNFKCAPTSKESQTQNPVQKTLAYPQGRPKPNLTPAVLALTATGPGRPSNAELADILHIAAERFRAPGGRPTRSWRIYS
eukprot:720749-Prorocentrum_minimum.AAC.2